MFEKLRGAGLKLSPRKCQLFQKEVRYLGFLISEKGLAADPEKTNAISTWPVPKDAHEIRSFPGLCSYYQRFVKGFAQITKPLNLTTKASQQKEHLACIIATANQQQEQLSAQQQQFAELRQVVIKTIAEQIPKEVQQQVRVLQQELET